MEKKNYFELFNYYKKYFFIAFSLIFLSLLICTLIIRKKFVREKNEKTIVEFVNIIDSDIGKKSFPINKQKAFFEKDHSIFNALIGINLAKRYFLKKDYEKSIEIIKKILSYTSEENLKYFIKLNLVKCFIKNKNFSSALEIINNVSNPEWETLFQSYKKKCIL